MNHTNNPILKPYNYTIQLTYYQLNDLPNLSKNINPYIYFQTNFIFTKN